MPRGDEQIRIRINNFTAQYLPAKHLIPYSSLPLLPPRLLPPLPSPLSPLPAPATGRAARSVRLKQINNNWLRSIPEHFVYAFRLLPPRRVGCSRRRCRRRRSWRASHAGQVEVRSFNAFPAYAIPKLFFARFTLLSFGFFFPLVLEPYEVLRIAPGGLLSIPYSLRYNEIVSKFRMAWQL